MPAPLGMCIPLNSTSSVAVCRKPRGVTGHHLRDSLITALTYGKLSRSLALGRRSVPTTRSISAWALRWTSGNTVMAAVNAVRVINAV